MISRKELFFQIILHILVFLFYSFDREDPGFKVHQLVFFLTYALAALCIGYFLMPRFLYRKQYWQFFLWVSVVIMGLLALEELVLEQIFFAGTRRAQTFPGIFFSLVGVVPVIAILTGFKFGWDALQKQEQIEALQLTVQESELQFLRSQINPHFLFNNLNNLYAHALEGSKKTPAIILELSGMLRYMLYECKERYVPLQKEIEHLQNFIRLYQLQIEGRGEVIFESNIMASGYKIAPLILIVFIENAFKHSQSGQAENISIQIDLNMEGNRLHFKCVNNFMAAEAMESVDQGIGLENVRKRLHLLYPEKHTLEINAQPKIYSVKLMLELEEMQLS